MCNSNIYTWIIHISNGNQIINEYKLHETNTGHSGEKSRLPLSYNYLSDTESGFLRYRRVPWAYCFVWITIAIKLFLIPLQSDEFLPNAWTLHMSNWGLHCFMAGRYFAVLYTNRNQFAFDLELCKRDKLCRFESYCGMRRLNTQRLCPCVSLRSLCVYWWSVKQRSGVS